MPLIVGLRQQRRQADPHRWHRLSSDAEDGAAKLSGEIEISGDGEHTRSFMHIDEYTDCMIRLAFSDIVEPLNIGNWSASTGWSTETIASVKLKRSYKLDSPKGVRRRNSDNELTSGKASIVNAPPRATIATA
jgi:nucleoside-diphosphate-sugar epimerase